MRQSPIVIPKISVILPVFNSAQYLPALLTSLLNQSEPGIEILAINDGSTDESLAILQRAAESDSRIVILNQQNGGPSAARNLGLKHARGQWIAFVDSDDWLDPALLATWYEYGERLQLDCLVGNAFCFKDALGQRVTLLPEVHHQQPWNEVISGEDWIIRSVAANEWRHYVWLQFTRRDFIVQNHLQFEENIIHEDILWTLHLALKAKRMGFLRTPLYGYRNDNSDSIMYCQSSKALEDRASSYLSVIQHLIAIACNQNAGLRCALLCQINREVGHFLGLIRKGIADPATKRRLAAQFLHQRLHSRLLLNVKNFRELWRAIRCWFILKKCVYKSSGKR